MLDSTILSHSVHRHGAIWPNVDHNPDVLLTIPIPARKKLRESLMMTGLTLGTLPKELLSGEPLSELNAATIAKYEKAFVRAKSGDDSAKANVCEFVIAWAVSYISRVKGLPRDCIEEFPQQIGTEFLTSMNIINDLQGWLTVRCCRLSIKDFRRHHCNYDIPLKSAGDIPEPVENRLEERVISELEFNHLLQYLPATQRKVVSLRLIDEMSFTEIGKQLSRRANSIRVEYNRALKRLSKRLSKVDGEGITNEFPASEPC